MKDTPAPCPGTRGTAFQPTFDAHFDRLWFPASLQHICCQAQYQQYSPEELRLADYTCDLRDKPKESISHQLDYEHLAESLHCRPVVRLPVITAGTINPAAVIKLQDDLEQARTDLRRAQDELRATAERHRQKSNGRQDQARLSKAALDSQLANTKAQARQGALTSFSEGWAKELLETNERVKALFQERLDNQLRDARPQGRENTFTTLSDEEAKKLLETNTTLMTMFRARLDIRVAQGVEDGFRMLSDSAVEVLFKANARVKAMFRKSSTRRLRHERHSGGGEDTVHFQKPDTISEPSSCGQETALGKGNSRDFVDESNGKGNRHWESQDA